MPARIRTLLSQQQYAVLATQGGGQPYASLVAFAASADLASIVFATPITTRKFRLLETCRRVALEVDDRSRRGDDLMGIEAVTATGRAERVGSEAGTDGWAELLTGRHPHLTDFVRAPSCAVFRIKVVRYLYVTRFQEVRQWQPQPATLPS